MKYLTIPETRIKIEEPAYDFLDHIEANDRILFSGAFGIGKTFFLRKFFETTEMKEKYNVFHLFPVNYQIATNEDIFELIKYDILYHIFGFDWAKVDDKKFSESLLIQYYFMNNSVNIISKIFQCVPVLEIAGKAIETLSNIHKNFLKYKDEINKNEVELLETFRKRLEQKQGSLYEFDAISDFICDNLANCNDGITDKEKYKKNVLIIDDLDRIDPEHIFRLLNVFSAHMDRMYDETNNKFGFDKIIFVCDVENIRNIFAAKYGQSADFSGYIDKFYSSEVFHFNNETAILEFVRKRIYDISNDKQNGFYWGEILCIRDILYLLVSGKSINLRQIFSNVESLKNTKIHTLSRYTYCSGYTIILTCLKILGGQKNTLLEAFKKVKLPLDNNIYGIEYESILSYLLPLLRDGTYNDTIEDGTVLQSGFSFKLKKENLIHSLRLNTIYAEIDTSTTVINYEKLQNLFIEVVNILDKKGLLK